MEALRVRLNRTHLSLALGALLLVIVSRVPIAPSVLSFDNVNFAFALEQFDPWMHQPHPPGYPFFVAEARIVNFFFSDAKKTFQFISIAVTWFSVVVAFLLGQRIFGTAAGCLGTLLLIFNPTAWHSGLDSPLRTHLAFFSLAVAYFCWRLWNGESRFGLWTALILGIGGGFRPDLLVYLFPLWCIAMWKSRNPWPVWVRGIGIIFAVTMIWVGAAAYAVGGVDRYTLLLWVYGFSAMSEGSVFLKLATWDWVYQVVHLLAWNGFGVRIWMWLIPIWLFVRKRVTSSSSRAWFVAAWIVPGMVVQGVSHVAAPGHTLFSVVAFSLVGGHVIAQTCNGLSERCALTLEIGMGMVATFIRLLLFFNILTVKIPAPAFAGEFGRVVTRAFNEGTHQTTLADLHAMNQLSESSVRDLKELLQSGRPTVIVSMLGSTRYFRFLHSRIASYYIADRDFWVVDEEEDPPRASRIRGKDLVEMRYGSTVKIPVPHGGRIIWLMDPASPFREAVSQAVSLKPHGNVFHTDLPPGMSQFRAGNFDFTAEE